MPELNNFIALTRNLSRAAVLLRQQGELFTGPLDELERGFDPTPDPELLEALTLSGEPNLLAALAAYDRNGRAALGVVRRYRCALLRRYGRVLLCEGG